MASHCPCACCGCLVFADQNAVAQAAWKCGSWSSLDNPATPDGMNGVHDSIRRALYATATGDSSSVHEHLKAASEHCVLDLRQSAWSESSTTWKKGIATFLVRFSLFLVVARLDSEFAVLV